MWIAQEVNQALGFANISSAIRFLGVSIDSRTIQEKELFVAIKGNNFDGHNFIKDALKKGATGLILEHIPEDLPNDIPFFLIENGMEALNKLAIFARQRTKAKIIAITGSAGKTTTKEMLSHILKSFNATVYTQGNYNNHIGVPLSLCALQADSKYGVFEIGTNHRGEIAPLSRMVNPNIAIITNIAPAHIGFIGSLELIAEEKSSIMAGLNQDGAVVFDSSSPFFDFLTNKAAEYGIRNIMSIGRQKNDSIRLLEYQPSSDNKSIVKAEILGKNIEYPLNFSGEHFALNSLMVIAVSVLLSLDLEQVVSKLTETHPIDGRGKKHLIKLPKEEEIFTLINDAYNANPASVKASLKALVSTSTLGHRIVILGEMPELGEYSIKLHQEIGYFINTLNIYQVFTVGESAKEIFKVLDPSLQGKHFTSLEDLKHNIMNFVKANDLVLLKGANKMKLYSLVEFFKKYESS